MRYEIDGGLLLIDQGTATDPALIMEVLGRAFSDNRLQPGAGILWDARQAPAQASATRMQGMLAGMASHPGGSDRRFALLVANARQFGVTRMLAAYAESYGIGVRPFFDVGEARFWLEG